MGKGLLAANAGKARDNRLYLAQRNVTAINLISSPGAGKTTLLEGTLRRLGLKAGVIEGDLYTALDAERLADQAAGVVQINTGGVCHLSAAMVERAMRELEELDSFDILFIENVGNLVCPAGFDLGEDFKMVLLSVAEGSDKPAKYRESFAAAQAVVITKADLLPYTDFDLAGVLETIRRINPDLPVMVTSVRTGEGMEAWCGFLERAVAAKKAAHRV
jgi:hydrogenase nickel incorporation protein HypB